MAGFEVVVRPVVFPDIRPAPPRSLPPQDDPEKGFAVIRGNGGKHIDLSYSYSGTTSISRPVETERRVDTARVYQQSDGGGNGGGGSVNRSNFVDVQVADRIKFKGANGGDLVGGPGGTGPVGTDLVQWYRPVQEAANIEVKRHKHILRSGEEFEG